MKVLIVDDEQPARDRLAQLLEDFAEHELAGVAANGQEALAVAAHTHPDVVLLDIRMPGMDGIETAHHLNALDSPPSVVFTTAYDEYAIDAFDAQAVGYVLKPVRRERLAKALEQAARLAAPVLREIASQPAMESQRQHVCARSQGELKLIPVDDVYFFQADQKYVCVQHARGQDLIDDSLKSLEKEFAGDFVRIHRGAVVAIRNIESVAKTPDGKHYVVLRDGTADTESLIISRRHVANVRRRLKGG